MESLPSTVNGDLISKIVCSVLETLKKISTTTEFQVTDSDFPILPATASTLAEPRVSNTLNFRSALLRSSTPTAGISGAAKIQSDNPEITQRIRPIKRGEFFSIPISEDLFQESQKPFLDSLIGRVIYSKGDKPVANLVLQRKLGELWNISSGIRLLPLGRGYYNLQFANKEDRDRAFFRQSWSLKPGLLRLQKWIPNFNPYKVNSSIAQVWVRVFELPIEYWRLDVFDAIAAALGTLIRVDDRTVSQEMCHYVHMLVEIDMKNPLQDKIMIERAGHCSFAFFQYERLPEFYKHCGIVGHPFSRCRSYADGDKGQDASRLQDNERRSGVEDVTELDSLHKDDSGVEEKEFGQGFEERGMAGECDIGISNS